MGRKLKSREKFLLFVLGLAVLVVAWFGLRGGGGLFGTAPEASEGDETELGEPPQVLMALLSREGGNYDPKGRNLFDYYTPPPPPRPTPPPPPPRRVDPTPPPPPRRTPDRIPAKPTAPQPGFTYLGYMGDKDAKIAVFERGGELLLAGVDEKIDDTFRLVEFKYETVVLGYELERFKDQTTELKMR